MNTIHDLDSLDELDELDRDDAMQWTTSLYVELSALKEHPDVAAHAGEEYADEAMTALEALHADLQRAAEEDD